MKKSDERTIPDQQQSDPRLANRAARHQVKTWLPVKTVGNERDWRNAYRSCSGSRRVRRPTATMMSSCFFCALTVERIRLGSLAPEHCSTNALCRSISCPVLHQWLEHEYSDAGRMVVPRLVGWGLPASPLSYPHVEFESLVHLPPGMTLHWKSDAAGELRAPDSNTPRHHRSSI